MQNKEDLPVGVEQLLKLKCVVAEILMWLEAV